ncbi:hypothetical protein PENSPDRAFT_756993 [Peniophora sp. CONT]|nr:hypothetical protein PENSPDRAFT_756993 [Peniophora sp. CONT]
MSASSASPSPSPAPHTGSSAPGNASLPHHTISDTTSEKAYNPPKQATRPNTPSDFCGKGHQFDIWMDTLSAGLTQNNASLPSDDFPHATCKFFSLPVSDIPDKHPLFERSQDCRGYIDELRAACIEGKDDPEDVVGLWTSLAIAYQMHRDEDVDELYMRRGCDMLIDYAFGKLSKEKTFGAIFEAEYWVPYSDYGPNRVPKTDVMVHYLLNVSNSDWTMPGERLADLRLYDKNVTTIRSIALVLLAIEYKRIFTLQARNQVLMDLISAARFVGYMGLAGITLFGILVTRNRYYLFSANAAVQTDDIQITAYKARPLTTFIDFIRLYLTFTDMRQVLVKQLDGRTINVAKVLENPPWRAGHSRFAGDVTGLSSGNDGPGRAGKGADTVQEPPLKKPRLDGRSPSSPRTPSESIKADDYLIIQQPSPIRAMDSFAVLDPSFIEDLSNANPEKQAGAEPASEDLMLT